MHMSSTLASHWAGLHSGKEHVNSVLSCLFSVLMKDGFVPCTKYVVWGFGATC